MRSYQAGIGFQGVGLYVAHNNVSHGPHTAITGAHARICTVRICATAAGERLRCAWLVPVGCTRTLRPRCTAGRFRVPEL